MRTPFGRRGPTGQPNGGPLRLPGGASVWGRSLRAQVSAGAQPDFGVYAAARPPAATPWSSIWLRWPDFWVPLDAADARDVLRNVYRRLADERCEVACGGGVGRTGTMLAALCILDGLSPESAVRWVRAGYHPRAVETPWQRRWLETLTR